MKLRPSFALVAAASLGWWAIPAGAHDNIVVHRRLGELSVIQLGNPFLLPYVNEVKEGSYGEDVPATRSLGHFYNPETDSAPWFALGAGPAWQNSQDQYNAALTEYGLGNYTGEDAAFYRMGRALHFIQDMTSVAHVHDDQHATDNEDFEDWGPGNINGMDFSNVAPKFAVVPTAEGYVKEIARLVYDMTSYQAELDAFDGCPSQCQPNSLLRTMFPSLHYEDGGFFDGDVWEIDDIGRTDTFASDDWWITDESIIEDNGGRGGSSRIRGDAYIENTAGNSNQPVPAVFNGQPNTNNETMLQLYGRILYPEAVAYGAGLLQLFADAVGAPPAPTSTGTPTGSATPTATELPPTNTPLVSNTPTSTSTPLPTNTPTQPPALCPAAPREDCRRPPSGKSVLVLKDKAGTFQDRLIWRWTKGDAAPPEFGNPFTGTSYALCLYDDDGVTVDLALSAEARAGDSCPGAPCWRSLLSGFKYSDRSANHDGLRTILLRGGTPSHGRLLVRGQGPTLDMPPTASPSKLLAQSPRVRVQLMSTGTVCWESVFTAPAIRNSVDYFKDRSD